jgi:hypothetical protein
MQVYYWFFRARERAAARRAREREEEFRRAEEVVALRAQEQQAYSEAELGAAVPPEQLPQEPSLSELPADPLMAADDPPARH